MHEEDASQGAESERTRGALARHELEATPAAPADAETAPLPRPPLAETGPLAGGVCPPSRAPAPASTSAARPGVALDGRFELLEELGRGGFGVVFRARDLELGREVALKLLRGCDDERRARFAREAELTATLDHPGIVRVHRCGEAPEGPYVVYELVDGARTLSEAFAGLAPAERAALVGDAARALGHAHARGVVHRDVKPANVLVDREGRVRVADFGLALAAGDERLTRSGEAVGTAHYLAPEAFVSGLGPIGPASDVWALGLVLYEALAERHPFAAGPEDDLAALLRRTALGALAPPRPPGGARPRSRVARALEAVCLRCLERDPARRYADGEALAAALDAALAGVAPRRGKTTPAIAALVALLLAAAIAYAAAGAGAARDRQAATPPARSAPSSESPSFELACARLEAQTAAIGSTVAERYLWAAFARVRAEPGAPRELLAYELLLLDDPVEARWVLRGVPSGPRRAALEALALLALGRAREAAALPALPPRVRGYAALLAGDVARARPALASPEDRLAVDVIRTANELRAQLATPAPDIHGWMFHFGRLLDLAAPLARGDLLQRIALRRALDAIPELALATTRFLGAFSHTELLGALDALVERGRALDACPGTLTRLDLARACPRLALGALDVPRRLRRAHPQRWTLPLPEELRLIATSVWFVGTRPPNAADEAEEALALRTRSGLVVNRVRYELHAGLARLYRDLACGAYARGERALGDATLERANAHGRARRREWAASGRSSALPWLRRITVEMEDVVRALVMRDLPAAREQLELLSRSIEQVDAGDATRLAAGEAVIALLAGECALLERDWAAARAAIEGALRRAPDHVRFDEAWGALAHLELLTGDRRGVADVLARLRAAPGTPSMMVGLTWHHPRERLGEVLSGGWWPGR